MTAEALPVVSANSAACSARARVITRSRSSRAHASALPGPLMAWYASRTKLGPAVPSNA
jgi:hypothetical protein